MQNDANDPVAQAEAYLAKRQFSDAARCFEIAAAAADGKKETAVHLRKAARAYAEMRETEDAARCWLEAARCLEGVEKAECFMDCFRAYILEIAGCEYDCGYEWRGATDGSHSDDHAYYQETIRKYQKEAQKVIGMALSVKGADKYIVMDQARDELQKRKSKGNWGADRCAEIISNVTNKYF